MGRKQFIWKIRVFFVDYIHVCDFSECELSTINKSEKKNNKTKTY